MIIEDRPAFAKEKMTNLKLYLNDHGFSDPDLDIIANMPGQMLLITFYECLLEHKQHVLNKDIDHFTRLAEEGGKFKELLGRCLSCVVQWGKEGKKEQVEKVWLYMELFCELSDPGNFSQ